MPCLNLWLCLLVKVVPSIVVKQDDTLNNRTVLSCLGLHLYPGNKFSIYLHQSIILIFTHISSVPCMRSSSSSKSLLYVTCLTVRRVLQHIVRNSPLNKYLLVKWAWPILALQKTTSSLLPSIGVKDHLMVGCTLNNLLVTLTLPTEGRREQCTLSESTAQ